MPLSNKNILSSIDADIALETPQATVEWEFDPQIPDIDIVRLRRSTFRFPEDITEGDVLLDESFDPTNPRTSFADTSVEAQKVHYYSVFFDLFGPFSMAREFEKDIERFGLIRSVRVKPDTTSEVIDTGTGATDTFTGSLTNTPVAPGSLSIVTIISSSTVTVTDDGQGNLIGDIGAGTNTINYVTGAYDVTFSGNPDSSEPITATYGHDTESYWLAGRDNQASQVFWAFNTRTELGDERIDVSLIMRSDEQILSLLDYVVTGITSPLTRRFDFLTNQRYIAVEIDDDATGVATADIQDQFELSEKLPPGFFVEGGAMDRDVSGGSRRIRILDSVNEEARLLTTTGTLVRTMDLSGLGDLVDNLRGLAYDVTNHRLFVGSGKVFFGIGSGATAPVAATLSVIAPIRQSITADPDILTTDFVLVDKDTEILERYTLPGTGEGDWQIEEPTVLASDILGIWRLNEAVGSTALVDASGTGNNGTLTGSPSLEVTGKFGNGIELLTISDELNFDAVASEFDDTSGFVSFWWKQPYEGYLPPSADRELMSIAVDASNLLRIVLLSSGVIRAQFLRSATSTVVESTDFSDINDGLFHHFMLAWDSTMELFIDGVSQGTAAHAGVFVGSPSDFTLGSASVSAIGTYDDLAFGDTRRSAFFTRFTHCTRGNRADALSGRDYATDITFEFRNKFKLYFDEYILRNEFQVQKLPLDKQLEDPEEIIFRDTAENLTVGHFSAQSRLFGLFLDRIVDRRNFFMNHLTASEVENDFIQQLGELIEAVDFDDRWNVDQKRRFLEVTYLTDLRFSTSDAFKRMARFLGFSINCPSTGIPVLVSRRRFDSVVDPIAPDTPFDTSVFDSGSGGDFQFVTLQFTFFREVFNSVVGVTSVPATRTLTDAGALFTETAEPGSLVFINDPDDPGDNGQYIVESVTSDTVLVVNRDWDEGSNTGLSYRLSWQVPCVDPFVDDEILSRFKRIKARWQALTCVALTP